MTIKIDDYLEEIYLECKRNIHLIKKVSLFIKKNKKNNFYFIGNGASNTIGSHFSLDFSKNLKISGFSLNSPEKITAISNDIDFKLLFAKYLSLHANKNDVLVAISSSGNSENIVNAIKFFKKKSKKIITLTGMSNKNKIIKINKTGTNIHVNLHGYNQIESAHSLILGLITDLIKGKKIYNVNS